MGWLVSLALVAVAAPTTASTATLLRETWDLLLWQRGPLRFHDSSRPHRIDRVVHRPAAGWTIAMVAVGAVEMPPSR